MQRFGDASKQGYRPCFGASFFFKGEIMYNVAIIGAGVVGGMIARELTKYGLKVCILEKENDVAMGATKANSAIVHAGFDAKEGSLKALLNVKGSMMMPTITKELGVKYQNNGALVIGFNESDEEAINELFERGIKNGVKGLEVLDAIALKEKEPNISSNAICALWAPTSAIVCPYELTIAAVGNAMDNGAELKLNFHVTEIQKVENGYLIKSNSGEIGTEWIINAAGIYADEIAKLAGDNSFDIHPRKGEYILLDKECDGLVAHTIFRTPSKMGKGILISPTVDNNVLLGPTSTDESNKEDTSTTQSSFDKIIKESVENVDNIPLNKAITSFCGIRAVGNTGDFIINCFKDNFINVAGIESPGLSASPAIAEYVREIMENKGVVLKQKSDFNPIRKPMHYFRNSSIAEKNKIIKENSAFGNIICRCEMVTEGEILEAIRSNPKPRDLDGVKRRTRAQMGRCQGGFCMPYIIELLSKELNIPYEEVTKFGGKSTVNVGLTKEMFKCENSL